MRDLTPDDFQDLIDFMNSSEFRKRFLDRVHSISLRLRTISVIEHGAQPCLARDLGSIEERVAWVNEYARQKIDAAYKQAEENRININFGKKA